MWLSLLIAISYCGIGGQATLLCEHYDNNPNETTDSPCKTPDQLNWDGSCNVTEECEIHDSNTHVHCFSSWSNISGVISIVRKGCWSQLEVCIGRTSCTSNHWKPLSSKSPKSAILFCCCNGDFCNADFNYEPIPDDNENVTPLEVNDSQNQTLMVLAYTLVPISLFSILVVFIYWLYRRKKQPYDDIDIASVETPGSRVTTSTMATTLLSPGQNDLMFPQLIEMKARGRFGCVWKAQLQDRYVAVKIFYLQDKQSWQNEQEIFSTELVHSHPNILHCITAASRGVGLETELWLITEFHELGSLADYLKVHTLSLPEALRFMETMATGLCFLHQDIFCNSRPEQNGYKPAIAHRDFKSKNVLITNQKTAVIADFGLAVKFIPGESTGESHGQVGTRRYMAPEILEGAINFQRDAFLRIDMYAFALVLWEVVTRCSDAPDCPVPLYMMPYEEELGQHPSLEEMQDCVVDKKIRPSIKDSWRQHEVIGIICETVEECWDHDAEARLSAGCVEQRLHNLQTKFISPPAEIPIHPNQLNPDVITNTTPTDTQIQNQINTEKNELAFNNRSSDESSRLINDSSSEPEVAFIHSFVDTPESNV